LLIDYETALCHDGVQDEIALLEAHITDIYRSGLHYSYSKFILSALQCVRGLVKLQKTAFKKGPMENVEQALRNVLKDMPLHEGLVPEKLWDLSIEGRAAAQQAGRSTE